MNAILRRADDIAMANWAQMVNILAPIMTSGTDSIRQTVFYPLMEYRRNARGEAVGVRVSSPQIEGGLRSLDAVATFDRASGEIVLFVVNIAPKSVTASITLGGHASPLTVKRSILLTGERLDAKIRSPVLGTMS